LSLVASSWIHGRRASFLVLWGDPAQAEDEARAGLRIAAEAGIDGQSASADGWFALGEALRLQGRRGEAGRAAERSYGSSSTIGLLNAIAAVAASRAHLHVDAGRPEVALELVRSHRASSGHRPPPVLAGLLDAAESRALAATGAHDEAVAVLRAAP